MTMHTYRKNREGHYFVGMWLSSDWDDPNTSFNLLFEVTGLIPAIEAVNLLNGGPTDNLLDVIKSIKKEY